MKAVRGVGEVGRKLTTKKVKTLFEHFEVPRQGSRAAGQQRCMDDKKVRAEDECLWLITIIILCSKH